MSQRLGWIGIDVGTHTVKLAQAVRDGADVRLHRAAVIQRPAAWSGADSLALEQPATSQAEIRAALECSGFSGRDAVCSLPMNACQLRGLSVPPGNDAERRTMVADELAEDWATLRSPMEFDFWETEPAQAEKTSDAFNVNVIAASRQWISQLWRDCRQSGLDCWSIDGTPLAMARAVSLIGGVGAGKRALAVDWGYSNTTLCVVGDERPLYSRRLHDCAFGRVLDGIMNTFSLSLDEAQHLAEMQGLEVPGAPDSSAPGADAKLQASITSAAAEPLNELARQIGRTLQFMETQRRHLQPEAMWLLGGGASMRNVREYLSRILPLPIHVWKIEAGAAPIACAAGQRSAMFGGAVALSALAWRAA
jgi:type IV pilus assembly protein PilM